jgi:SET domain-containing protein
MVHKRLVVKRSTAGLGLFARKDIAKDVRVIEYTGEVISEAEANRRGGKYLFELNARKTIDGKGRENIARYINHSCRPNCYPELNASETRVFIIAKRNIKAGEEITYHYGKTYFDDLIKPIGCRCRTCQTKALTPSQSK